MADWFGTTTRTPRGNALMSLPDYGYGPMTPTTQGGRQNAMMTATQAPQRPNDYLAPVAEMISPTMGAYGAGQAAAELSRAVEDRDWKQAAEIGLPMLAMFAGPGAKTANKGMLAKAEQMASAGMPREKIWNDTGWFKGVDGGWRYEIDDSGMKLLNKPHDTLLEDGIAHPALFEAYPKVKSGIYKSFDYDPNEGLLGGFDGRRVEIARNAPGYSPDSTMVHELQHFVQDIEGFGKGGNALSYINESGTPMRAEIASLESRLGDIFKQSDRILRDANKNDGLFSRITGKNRAAMSEFDRLQAEARDIEGRLGSAREQAQSAGDREMSPLGSSDFYDRMSGEVEARATEKRRTLNDQQRRDRAPWLDYDVPEDQQIVRFGPSGPNAMMQSVSGAPKKGIRAFHGSPHDFDKFSLDKIGTAGDGSRNYVVFDDALIEILRKYGLLGTLGGAGAAGAIGRGQSEESY